MTKKIFHSILLAAASVLLASLMIVMGCLYGYFRTVQENQLKDELRLAAYAVEENGLDYLERLTGRDYRYAWTSDYRLTWISPDGTVLFDTAEPGGSLENHAGRAEVREAFAKGESSSVRYSTTLMEQTLYYARALNDGTVLRISISRVTVPALVLVMLQPILIVVVIAVILSAVLAHWMAKKIVRPLDTLDLDHPLDNDAYEELKPLLRRIHQQNRQVSAAESSRREFTANVSHELKTPLQSILGSAELLKNGLVKPEDIPHFAGLIHTEAARLVALVEDIIHLSQLDEGTAPAMESVDLLEIAEDVAAALQGGAEEKNVGISVTGGSVIINGAHGFLHEMIYNLCDNAVKYNVAGGHVELAVLSGDDGPTICVKDTGIGIPQEYQSRVFERFFRVDKSRSKASGGTGLGLSIVKHIAQYHHGLVSLCSKEGEGTTITVVFPQTEIR